MSEREPFCAGFPISSPPLVVVMGVSGSGKNTIGVLLALALGVAFIDGDSLHSTENVAKMATGMPLTDDDRWPWLAKVGRTLAEADSTGLVVACSALRRVYRDAILREAPAVIFLHLAGSRAILASRLESRSGHFMPASLLDSQFSALELLQPDEVGVAVSIDASIAEVVEDALVQLHAVEVTRRRARVTNHAGEEETLRKKGNDT